MSKKDDKTLSQQLAELDNLLQWFERDDFLIEEALDKYEHGIQLVKELQKQLQTIENKVEILNKKFDQES